MPHTIDQKINALLEQETSLRQWLEQIRALTKDARGATVIAGLTQKETEDFLLLSPLVRAHDSGMTSGDAAAARARHAELKAKLENALQDNAIESLSGWGDAAARAH
ncbi:MAG: hypothetical protein ACOY6K_11550 [Pseudomonadota bacterium]